MTDEKPEVEGADEELSHEQIGALFCEDLEPERVAVPGHSESWVELLPMDAAAMNRYLGILQDAQQPKQPERKGVAPPPSDFTGAVEYLLCETLQDWNLVGKKSTLTPPDPGRQDADRVRKGAVKAMVRGGRQGITAQLTGWLVGECNRVNHITEAEQGTEERQGN